MATDSRLVSMNDAGTGGVVTTDDDRNVSVTGAPSTIEAMKISDRARTLSRSVRALRRDVEEVNSQVAHSEWETRTSTRLKKDALSDLLEVARQGFAWRDIARVLGVSVPAIQKWRRGESISPDRKRRIHEFAAACDYLASTFEVDDVASWFAIPLSSDAPTTPIDLWAAGQVDLVFDASREGVSPESVLNRFEPDWQSRHRSNWESFRSHDGKLSLRLRER